jgi:uncharacterized membrane protein
MTKERSPGEIKTTKVTIKIPAGTILSEVMLTTESKANQIASEVPVTVAITEAQSTK